MPVLTTASIDAHLQQTSDAAKSVAVMSRDFSGVGLLVAWLCGQGAVMWLQELDVNRLLLVIHEYFSGLGVDEIRRRGAQDEQSLRMVKTLVHELCKVMVSPARHCRLPDAALAEPFKA